MDSSPRPEIARTIPQIDRMSRKDALYAMQKLSPGPLPTDANATFKWWMFISNLGEHSNEIIARGIVSAELADKSGNAVILLLHRQNHTQVALEVCSRSTKMLESIVSGSTTTSDSTSSQ